MAFVEHLDHDIGTVIKTLEKSNQIKNTVIIFTSDNGGPFTQRSIQRETSGRKTGHVRRGYKSSHLYCMERPDKIGNRNGEYGTYHGSVPYSL